MLRSRYLRRIFSLAVVAVLLMLPASAKATSSPVIVPPPEPGSFFTLFDYALNGKILAFDGFTVHIQQHIGSPNFVELGTLPEEYRGATDPAFMTVSPNGQKIILAAGAGGSQFPDPAFNGNIFVLPITGGEATLLGTFPFSIMGIFRHSHELFFGQGETFGFFTGSVEYLNVNTLQQKTVIGNIPGDPGGLAFNFSGDLFVGLGAGQDTTRTGEIHKFTRTQINNALQTGVPLDFDADSTIVAQVLNAGDLEFDLQGDLFVGGADFIGGGETGFIAEVDVATGQVVDRFDPTDGDPDDGDALSFQIALGPLKCRLGALDLISFFTPDEAIVYERLVCV